MDLSKLSPVELKSFFDSFDTVLIDCDGVVNVLFKAIEGAVEAINKLKSINKNVRFVSNNSLFTLQQLKDQLASYGLEVRDDELSFPTLCLLDYLKSIKFDKKIFLCAGKAIKYELEKAGYEVTSPEISEVEESIPVVAKLLEDDSDIGALVVDLDINLTFEKLLKASIYLRRPDVLFCAGGCDTKIPIGNKKVLIGPGMILKMLEEHSGRKAKLFSKPSADIVEFVINRFKIKDCGRTLFIGDSLHHDMGFATICGFQKLLVLTGVSSLDDAKSAPPECRPDFVLSSLGEISTLINNKFSQ